MKTIRLTIGFFFLASCTMALAPMRAQQPTFRSTREVVSIDVVVRDRNGEVVRGLTAADFEIREDGELQEVLTFSFQDVNAQRTDGPARTIDLLERAENRVSTPAKPATPGAVPDESPPLTPQALAGRRLIVLLFDISSMEPEDVQRAVDSARKYVEEQMSDADMVAVATIGSMLDVLTDFTGERTRIDEVLGRLAFSEGTATEEPAATTAATEEEVAEETESAEVTELEMFNNDVRLRALRTLAETLSPIEQKKAIVYFSAGMQRTGQDNLVELRSAINAAVRAHVAIYPIDTRGLQAVTPGGDARQASGRGQALFSGRGMARQFSQLAASQDTLTSLAADTGGRAFTDTNDFGEVFARVQRDMAAYYLLGYSSTNPTKDGRFRRVRVQVKKEGYRVEARPGYFAARDFSHTSRGDRETQLQEQLFAPVSDIDLPVLVSGAFFRLTPEKYYVPISVAIPGSVLPAAAANQKRTLDILGAVRDEQGRPVGRIRQTMTLDAGDAALEGKQVLYQTSVTLPPGRFAVKVVVRENVNGTMGSFETPLLVPELKQASMKVSSVILSTQLQQRAGRSRSDNPLARDGVELIPNLTHVVGRDQKLFFYFEVYEPAASGAATSADLVASLAFYRGKVKVLETPAVERAVLDAVDRKAAVFRLEVDGSAFAPGLYTCQLNIIDAAAGTFAFPRLAMLVR